MTSNVVPADDDLVELRECPPGVFEFNGSLGFKTEYGMTLPDGPTEIPGDQIRWKVTNWPDAYCLDSGEVFWGGAETHEDRAKLLVRPLASLSSELARCRNALERIKRISLRDDMGAPVKIACIQSIAHDAAPNPIGEEGAREP